MVGGRRIILFRWFLELLQKEESQRLDVARVWMFTIQFVPSYNIRPAKGRSPPIALFHGKVWRTHNHPFSRHVSIPLIEENKMKMMSSMRKKAVQGQKHTAVTKEKDIERRHSRHRGKTIRKGETKLKRGIGTARVQRGAIICTILSTFSRAVPSRARFQ